MKTKFMMMALLTMLLAVSCEKSKRVAIGGDDQIIVMADSIHWPVLLYPLQEVFEREYRVPIPEKEFYLQFVNISNFDHYKNYKYIILAGTFRHQGPVSSFIAGLLSEEARKVIENKEHFWFNKYDEWAYGQYLMILVSDSIYDLADLINRNSEELYAHAIRHKNKLVSDFIFSTGKYLEKKELPRRLYEQYGWSIRVHPDYRIGEQDSLRQYVRFYAPSMNKSLLRWISVHWMPVNPNKPIDSLITPDWMSETRNKLGRWFVDTTVTVPQYDRFEKTEFAGYSALRYDGVWRTPSPRMPYGGAFRAFAFTDSATQRIYFIDLAVFFPEEPKKIKNLREQEAIARTFSTKPLLE